MTQCPYCGKINKTRTTQQNRAVFGIGVKMLADHLGYTKEEIFDALAGEFFGYTEINIKGKIVLVRKSTKNRTTEEYSRFYEFIQQVGAENGIYIQSPNEPSEAIK